MKIIFVLIIRFQVFSSISASIFDFNLNDFQTAAKRIKRAARPTCFQPAVTPDKKYKVKFPNQEDLVDAKPGKAVPQFTIIESECNKGYVLNYPTVVSNEVPSVCSKDNSWRPPLLKCKKICKNFSSFLNFDMSCYEYHGGPKISCVGLLLEGAIVKPKCKEKFHPDIKVNYDHATCLEDGNWDKPFFKCVPDCGVGSKLVTLIVNGTPEIRGGSPWYVAIYRTKHNSTTPDFICGGTLISAELVISAAHCFYDEIFHQAEDTGLFHAIIAKSTLDYHKKDYTTTRTYRLKNIFFPDTVYNGMLTNYAADIVILHLSEKVSFSQDVLPACLKLNERGRFTPDGNVMGKLSGFGLTATGGDLATQLLTAYLPFISYTECLPRVEKDFVSSVSFDKFCAGSEKGRGARQGDSGGGVLFRDKETGLFHLRGVVSNKDLSGSSISTCTDVVQHMQWIEKTIKTIEGGYTIDATHTVIDTFEPTAKISDLKVSTEPPKPKAECGATSNSAITLIAGGERELRGGAPWYVAIYSTQFNSKTPEFICGGTLISAQLVISASLCFFDEKSHRAENASLFHVIVGKNTQDYQKQDYETTKTYRLKNIYFPDIMFRKTASNYAANIAILQLSEKVSFSTDVLPACVHWGERGNFNPGDNVIGKLSGFGITATDGPSATQLHTAYLPYISNKECLEKVKSFLNYVSLDKFCAGSERGIGAQKGDMGGGLLFKDRTTGLFYLRGVICIKDSSKANISTYTDIAHYMHWIRQKKETIEGKSTMGPVGR